MTELMHEQGLTFEKLLQQEAAPADPSEVIALPSFSTDAPELALCSSELGSKLADGNATREELLQAGFAFINTIGRGEKPLLAGQIPITNADGGTSTLNLTRRTLLTGGELSQVLQFQQTQPENYDSPGTDVEAIRADMLQFLMEGASRASNPQEARDLFRLAQGKILDGAADEDREIFLQWFKGKIAEQQESGFPTLKFVMDQATAKLDIVKVRGIPVELLPTRLGALKGLSSPFIDSGFHFDTNYDITLFPADPSRTRRLNMVNIHLLSRGLNEMGGSLNSSHDQTYLTAGEYVELTNDTLPAPTDEREKMVGAIATRLIAAARRDM